MFASYRRQGETLCSIVVLFLVETSLFEVTLTEGHALGRLRDWPSKIRGRERRADDANITSSSATATEAAVTYGDGTTANLRDIFLGRCFEYRCKYCDEDNQKPIDCLVLWQAFNLSFAYRNECSTSPEDFEAYVNLTFTPLPPHKTLFYSGMYSIANTMSSLSDDHVNIERTLLGRLVDAMIFCSQPHAPGINYDRCPVFDSCTHQTRASFWAKSSQRFAGESSGDVIVVLDGSRIDGAYRETSFFRSKEVQNLDPSKVSSLTAYVVHNLDGTITESCVNGSLLDLKQHIEEKGIQFHCIDNPSITRYIQCSSDPGHSTCTSCPGSGGVVITVTWTILFITCLFQKILIA
ncbi:ADP-ribosyl cyclase/cyclic ADP-ribose hydrolase-like [Diadema antillarum]|uniref:ADP-ribosyl cyclase/cyclic ADP-ribose hydrolase-like n=1 Tax=Diadema antillarum TaxID=105358 RepID=UPI003A8388A1